MAFCGVEGSLLVKVFVFVSWIAGFDLCCLYLGCIFFEVKGREVNAYLFSLSLDDRSCLILF